MLVQERESSSNRKDAWGKTDRLRLRRSAKLTRNPLKDSNIRVADLSWPAGQTPADEGGCAIALSTGSGFNFTVKGTTVFGTDGESRPGDYRQINLVGVTRLFIDDCTSCK